MLSILLLGCNLYENFPARHHISLRGSRLQAIQNPNKWLLLIISSCQGTGLYQQHKSAVAADSRLRLACAHRHQPAVAVLCMLRLPDRP